MAKKKGKERTDRLPGMEDAGIKELEKLAEDLNDTRTERIRLSKEEGDLQEKLLTAMKKHGKIEYHHEEVHAWREIAEEKVKVKIGELTGKKAKEVAAAVEEVKQHEDAAEKQEAQNQQALQ